MDTSIRFKTTGNFSHIKRQLLQTDGILQMINVVHSIYAATHKQLYEYFPTNMEKVKSTRECMLSCFLIFNTSDSRSFFRTLASQPCVYSLSKCSHTSLNTCYKGFLKNKLKDISPCCGATDTLVLDFWWRLSWVSKPGWIALLRSARQSSLFDPHTCRSCVHKHQCDSVPSTECPTGPRSEPVSHFGITFIYLNVEIIIGNFKNKNGHYHLFQLELHASIIY